MISLNLFNWLMMKLESRKVEWFAQSQMVKITESSRLRTHFRTVINMKSLPEFYYYAHSNLVVLARQMLLQKTYSICPNHWNRFTNMSLAKKERGEKRGWKAKSKAESVSLIFPFASGSEMRQYSWAWHCSCQQVLAKPRHL